MNTVAAASASVWMAVFGDDAAPRADGVVVNEQIIQARWKNNNIDKPLPEKGRRFTPRTPRRRFSLSPPSNRSQIGGMAF